MNEVNWMQQGWECPKCGAVMSPSTSCCVNCRGNKGGGIATTIGVATDYNFKVAPQSTTGDSDDMLRNRKETPEEQWDRYYLNV